MACSATWTRCSLVPSLTRLGTFWALNPAKVFEQTTKYYQQSLRASMAFAARSVGAAVDGPAATRT